MQGFVIPFILILVVAFVSSYPTFPSALAAPPTKPGSQVRENMDTVNPHCRVVSPEEGAAWTGNYQAEESVTAKGFAPQFMIYQATVVRDAQGILRATISIDGHLTNLRMSACGEPKKNQLILYLLQYSEADQPKIVQLHHPVLTLETDGPRAWMMGFPEVGSYLRNKPFIPAKRLPNK